MTYSGSLTTTQRRTLRSLYPFHSVREIAKLTGLPYGQVRGYAEHLQDPTNAIPAPPGDGPAILFYDIETAPALVWVWSQWQTNVIATEQDWYMLSFAAKWRGSDEVFFVSIAQDPTFAPNSPNDRFVAERLREAFDRADVTVAHNGDKFDKRKANARFLYHDIDPPAPYETVDTKKEASRYFANYSNSLKELGRVYGLGGKVQHTGFDLWRDCMAGDRDAWAKMEEYNRQDVVLLEKLYDKLTPFTGTPGTQGRPNMGHWKKGETVCPKCGGDDLIKRGYHRTKVSEFRTIQCKSCGGYSRLRFRRTQAGGNGVELV